MNIKKAICAGLLLSMLIVSGYANRSICKNGVCFEIIFKQSIESIVEGDPCWKKKTTFGDKVTGFCNWAWLSEDEKTVKQFEYMDKLLENLKIRVNGKELELMPAYQDVESGDYAKIYTIGVGEYGWQYRGAMCVIAVRVQQRMFEITLRPSLNEGLTIENIEEIAETGYPIPESEQSASEEKEEKTPKSFMQVNSTPALYQGIAFTLVLANESILEHIKTLKELVNSNGLKLRVHDRELELMSNDCGSSDRAIVYALMDDHCVIRMVSVSAQRIFDIIVSTKNDEIVINDIKEMPKREYFVDHMNALGLGRPLGINQTPFPYQSQCMEGMITFTLIPAYNAGLVHAQNLEELVRVRGFKIHVHGGQLKDEDLELKDERTITKVKSCVNQYILFSPCRKYDEAIVYSLKNDECVIQIWLHGYEFVVSILLTSGEIIINSIKELG